MKIDLLVEDGTGPEVIAELDAEFKALAQWYADTTDPATAGFSVPYMWWIDKGNNLVKQRNADDTAWVSKGKLLSDGTVSWDGTSSLAESVGNITVRKNSTTYELESIVFDANLPSWAYLKCTSAGITGTSEPAGLSSVVNGSTISDGSVIWTVGKIGDNASTSSNQTITTYLTNGSYTALKDGTIKITAVAGGGGGSTVLAAGGGSGQSCVDYEVSVSAGDIISWVIGAAGAGSTLSQTTASSTAPTDSLAMSGSDGGNTLIYKNGTLIKTLTGGKGAVVTSFSGLSWHPGTGEQNGNTMSITFANGTSAYFWGNANGASSIFGTGGQGGYCNSPESGTNIAPGGNPPNDAFGAGGAGGGFSLTTNYRWTAAGDGMHGAVVLEVI